MDSTGSIKNASFCNRNRGFNVESKNTTPNKNAIRKNIILDTIWNALTYNEKHSTAIMDYMNSRYDEVGYTNVAQRQIRLAYDQRNVMRYISCELRKPTKLLGGQVDVGGKQVKVHPDLAFIDDKASSITLVHFGIGRPIMTQSGKHDTYIRDIQLYAMVLYGRQLGYKNVIASFYYLQKETDRTNSRAAANYYDPDFFGSGSNIVSLSDTLGARAELDAQVSDSVKIYSTGVPADKIAEDDCKLCPNYDLCQYTMPPIKLVNEQGPIAKDFSSLILTHDQQTVVNINTGLWRVNAGAGAGKTMCAVLNVVNLLLSGVPASHICMITFTNAGAAEMYRRVKDYLTSIKRNDIIADDMVITTFNSFGNTIVNDNYKLLQFSKKPKLIDDVERFSIIAKILNANPIPEWNGESFLNFTSSQRYTRGALQIMSDVFSIMREDKVTNAAEIWSLLPGADVAGITQPILTKIVAMYDIYAKQMMAENLIEYSDQENMPFDVFNLDPNYLPTKYPFEHVIVDEFQDSNEKQIELIKILRHLPSNKSLMVVGDDSQAIFGFRKTSPEFIINFQNYIGEPVQDVYLVENHRSTPQIIDFANKINALNKNKVDKDLVATRASGAPVIVNGFMSKPDEYKYISDGIKRHVDAGMAPENIAFIAYSKTELAKLADLLTKMNIPSMICAPEVEMDNSRIRAILNFATLLQDRSNSRAALICANALVGGMIMDLPEAKIKVLTDNMIARADQIDKAGSLVGKKEGFISFIDSIGMDDEVVESFKDGLSNKDYGEILQYCTDFLQYGEKVEFRRLSDYPGVVLTTAHSSKGLEWPVVYNSISKYQNNSTKISEETRRLLFVSCTRARDELYVTGQYAVSSAKDFKNRQLNEYLKEAYAAAGQVYNPVFN